MIGSGTKLIAGNNDGIFVSADDGQSWIASNNGLPSAITVLALVSLNNNIFAATDKGIWKSDNDAQSWSDANAGIINNQTVWALYVYGASIFASTSSNTNYYNTGKVIRSSNLGQNWSEVNSGLPQSFSSARSFASIANTIFVLIDGELFRSNDNGNTWLKTNTPPTLLRFNFIATSGPVIFAVGTDHPDPRFWSASWTSSDFGDSWNLVRETLDGFYGNAYSSLRVSGTNVFITGYYQIGPPNVFSKYCLFSSDAWKTLRNTEPPDERVNTIFDRIFLVNGRGYLTQIENSTGNFLDLYQSNKFLAPVATTVSAANYQLRSCAVSAFGSSLTLTMASAAGMPLPTSLENSSVTVSDSAGVEKAAPLFYISPTQINFQIPAGLSNGVGTFTIRLYNQIVAGGVLSLANTSPGLFTVNQTGEGFAATNVQRVKPGGTSS